MPMHCYGGENMRRLAATPVPIVHSRPSACLVSHVSWFGHIYVYVGTWVSCVLKKNLGREKIWWAPENTSSQNTIWDLSNKFIKFIDGKQ
jgi:hypothetical protein